MSKTETREKYEDIALYKKMYLRLFNAVTDALDRDSAAEIKFILMKAQAECEDIYSCGED